MITKTHLVRHARAVPRSEWRGEDLLRPLSARGQVEAEALAQHLAGEPIERIVCAPSLRCQQTVEPLAVALDVDIEVDERLGKDESVVRALELLPAGTHAHALFCSHAEIIVPLLQVLELGGAESEERIPCKKGSLWTLSGAGCAASSASYFEPVRRSKRRHEVSYSPRDVPRRRSTRAAVLDLGSTSFTLLIADVRGDGEIRTVVREKVMLRLGASIGGVAGIPAETFDGAVEVAGELHSVAQREKCDRVLVVATAAVRDARNGRDLAAAISRALGHPVRILSGEEEARTIFLAFQRRLTLGDEPVLGMDLGGGSLELAVGSASGVRREVTLPLGVVRLCEELAPSDPMTSAQAGALRDRVRKALVPHRESLLEWRPEGAVATGGSVRALARLVAERGGRGAPEPRGSLFLEAGALAKLRDQLVRSTHDERLGMRGIRRNRADLLPTAALVLETVLDELGVEGLTICDWGLREGVLLDAIASARA